MPRAPSLGSLETYSKRVRTLTKHTLLIIHTVQPDGCALGSVSVFDENDKMVAQGTKMAPHPFALLFMFIDRYYHKLNFIN